MRELKVYGGRYWVRGGHFQSRALVATRTKKRAIEILGISASEFNNYWCETGNTIELEVAMNEPETVFYYPKGEEFRPDRVLLRLKDEQ